MLNYTSEYDSTLIFITVPFSFIIINTAENSFYSVSKLFSSVILLTQILGTVLHMHGPINAALRFIPFPAQIIYPSKDGYCSFYLFL